MTDPMEEVVDIQLCAQVSVQGKSRSMILMPTPATRPQTRKLLVEVKTLSCVLSLHPDISGVVQIAQPDDVVIKGVIVTTNARKPLIGSPSYEFMLTNYIAQKTAALAKVLWTRVGSK